MGTHEERIAEYNEQLHLLKEGIEIYEKKSETDHGQFNKWESKSKLLELRLKHKKVTATVLQLTQLMKEAKSKMATDIKNMKNNWDNVLKEAMDRKDKFSRDDKKRVIAIKDMHIRKSFQGDEHKVQMWKTLLTILQSNSNGKSI